MSRVGLVIVAGLPRRQASAVATRLMHAAPGSVVVHHDLRDIAQGFVVRRQKSAAREEVTRLELAHGCVSCTLREDLLPLLAKLAESDGVHRVIVHLDPTIEPEPVCWAIRALPVWVTGVVTVVDMTTWLADATGDEELAERGFGVAEGDDRTVAQVAVGQAEFADAIVLTGAGADAWTDARTSAVLQRIAPLAKKVAFTDAVHALRDLPEEARRGRVDRWFDPLLHGQPPLESDCGVSLTVFTERRPFHPHRLHDAIGVLLEGVVRVRGRFWLASQPDVALWFESAGGALRIGQGGPWLATMDDWSAECPQRTVKASLEWHPRFGDRVQELTIVAHQAHPDELTAALHAALLSDEELAEGEEAWLRYPDPLVAIE
ncbi:ribosome hibernation factor-recruiting GTPase MRF [Kibdelosporangium persicum]|uniref:Cobalamin biosynthesis protein CobW n=1 Tax=Kibdelosporangium persicum TaxID=2698649 RepID=A0ABX2FIS4_9PSEU|nr:GTP-binding protein [Kibdelosporangium persicum]NRN70715.1 Cobalamin biosynthesis protein CobW [Kibdelosporangium persicum]